MASCVGNFMLGLYTVNTTAMKNYHHSNYGLAVVVFDSNLTMIRKILCRISI